MPFECETMCRLFIATPKIPNHSHTPPPSAQPPLIVCLYIARIPANDRMSGSLVSAILCAHTPFEHLPIRFARWSLRRCDVGGGVCGWLLAPSSCCSKALPLPKCPLPPPAPSTMPSAAADEPPSADGTWRSNDCCETVNDETPLPPPDAAANGLRGW